MEYVIFLVLALVTLACALVVVASRNLFHSAIFLVFSFIGVAGVYLMLQAEFLAGIQILIYVGAIATLIVFAIMVSRDLGDPNARSSNRQWAASAIVALLILVVLVVVLLRAQWPVTAAVMPSGTLIADLGEAMVSSSYVLPFEVVSALLLVALIGSVIIARDR